jgi:protein gp37
VTGCTEVSPGCDHCYARTFAERFRGVSGHPYEHGFDLQLRPERLGLPLQWKRPRRIFVNSMSDLFHAGIPEAFIAQVWATMAAAPQHTFQCLTKRAERMERVISRFYPGPRVRPVHPPEFENWLPNVWLGVSVESTTYYSRIRHLQRTPAAVRFLSLEPLLGPLPNLPLEGISWVIVGGESGPGARPMHPDWVRTIQAQCEAAGVAFFLKQWGEWTGQAEHFPPGFPSSGHWRWVTTDGTQHTTLDGCLDEQEQAPIIMARVGKRAAGRLLDGRTWDEYPPLQAPTEVLP